MNYKRLLNLKKLLTHTSLFLLGPRQTGKTTLLKELFPDAYWVNLLEADTFRELSANPEYLRQRYKPTTSLIIIDEVQKLPGLLDEVQGMIQNHPHLRFILTGSSARKLKRGGANLLAGRAWECHLHPLISKELQETDLIKRLNIGGLPAIYNSEFPEEHLKAYVGTYLQEEIQAEGLSRNIGNFSRFLQVAGLTNTLQLNFAKVASDTGIPARTIREYYQILEDTLIGTQLAPYSKTVRRKPVATSKFYFFDLGIANFLMRRGVIQLGSESFGKALEHLIFLELRAALDYFRQNLSLCYWRSTSQLEVDFVLGDAVGVEVKAGSQIHPRDFKGLVALSEEVPLKRKIVVCSESQFRKTSEGVEIFPVQEFLKELWEGAFFESPTILSAL